MDGCGFEEVVHTADWAIRVWAPDFSTLFLTAAQGMYSLMDIRIKKTPRRQTTIKIAADDIESLLVAFLSELLYLANQKRISFDQFDLTISPTTLFARIEGSGIIEQRKEIKAVTFNNVSVTPIEHGFETFIVFDV